MRRHRLVIAKTRTGRLRRLNLEHYLRDDLSCGSAGCSSCIQSPSATTSAADLPLPAAAAAAAGSGQSGAGAGGIGGGDGDDDEARASKLPTYLVLDTNVLLHQMDLLETAVDAFQNLILLQTVLQEAKHRKFKVYQRIRKLLTQDALKARPAYVFCNEHHRETYVGALAGESPNDRNDRAIRVASRWYALHLKDQARVILITNDADNKQKALQSGIDALTIREFISRQKGKRGRTNLMDLLAAAEEEEREREAAKDWAYERHLSPEEVSKIRQAAANGEAVPRLVEGTFKVSREYWKEGTVRVKGMRLPVLISGQDCINRAVDGDRVVVQLFPRSKWKAPSTRLPENEFDNEDVASSQVSGENGEAGDDQMAGDGEAAAAAAAGANEPDSGAASDRRRPSGKVVSIVTRNWRAYCGSFEVTDKKSGSVLFLPVSKRVPRIRVESRQIAALMDQRILVQIDAWPRTSRYPRGHYVRTMGPIGDRDTETAVLLMEHDVPDYPWPAKVLACLPPEDFSITNEERRRRVDLRDTRIFSIDPPGCTDIDDALHCELLPNGNFNVGVHIADVTHFVRPDSALDLEAAHRGTSVYLVDRRIDMLPSMLSTDLCSLRAHVERLAFSVVWEMTPQAEIVNTKFHKSVIKSVAAFTYAQAQERLDAAPEDASKPGADMIKASTQNLNKLAKMIRARRIAAGALALASPQVKFLLDSDSQKPTDVAMYELREANQLVEEFMLLANISVAKRTLEAFPKFAMLRRHPTPTPEMLEPLVRAAGSAGFEISTGSSRALADSLDRCVIDGFPYFNQLVRILATRCMTQAVYFSSGDLQQKEYHHYGLASPVYTHFTSPIRRYADIVVHRLLATLLGIDPLPAAVQDKDRMRQVADDINHRNRMAQQAGRASVDLYTLIYFRDKRVEEDAMVIAVHSNGIRVLVPRFGIEGRIRLVAAEKEEHEAAGIVDVNDEEDDSAVLAEQMRSSREAKKNPWNFDEENLTLSSAGLSFRMFQQVRVAIYVQESQARRRWLQVDLLGDDGQVIDVERAAVLGAAAAGQDNARPKKRTKTQDSRPQQKRKGRKRKGSSSS